MFRNIIAPVQTWLLSRGQCVACSMPLVKGIWVEHPQGKAKVTCACGRIFIYAQKSKKFRRARFEEV